MNTFLVRIKGLEELKANMRMYPREMHAIMCKELHREATDIVEDSVDYVPIISGELRDSRFVTPVIRLSATKCRVIGGYSAPYAMTVHENAQRESRRAEWERRYKYQQFGQWKFLEQPFLLAMQGMVLRLARALSGVRIGAVGRRAV